MIRVSEFQMCENLHNHFQQSSLSKVNMKIQISDKSMMIELKAVFATIFNSVSASPGTSVTPREFVCNNSISFVHLQSGRQLKCLQICKLVTWQNRRVLKNAKFVGEVAAHFFELL
jgi:hypothetical protein